mmetsp:Transcript_39371/g.104530  ORF Transcript_39371/g.104530 Transcript_39371/m.104530 type:complete len:246 (-) Transcript_39371:929-1666(-)
MVRMLRSKMMSWGLNLTSLTRILKARSQMRTLLSQSAAWPSSSKAMTMTAAPYRLRRRACLLNSSSPTLSEIEFTTHLPWRHSRPAMQMGNLDESMTMGTLAISGSVAIRLQNLRMQSMPSSIPSSKLMSMSCAPSSTCLAATSAALPQLLSMTSFLKRMEPATLQRSPMFWNTDSGVMAKSSRPDSRMWPLSSGTLRAGLTSATASAIALMWSGVVPQQPPTMLTRPSCAQRRRCGAMSLGWRS